ncbi:MAG: cupin domain-containing protein [Planctomycetes bacterium]|jgi:mannose-6-phosphate isomerase-like protein (cupin superfamily)|nr:cupin domain-containing protein [Planctomycetota bacterium]MCL4730802.1 cupin domain-containing protein [Planctomycetota bacterium]
MNGKVNLAQAFARIARPWSPTIVGELNGQYVKLGKFDGAYVWHAHEAEDELFLVVSGRLNIELRDRTVELAPGEFFVVPRGTEHRPVAQPAAEVLLFEPAGTINTGNAPANQWTRKPEELDRL